VSAGLLLVSPSILAAQEDGGPAAGDALGLTDQGYFHARGLDVLAFANWYSGLFSDSKLSGIELVHHGVRVATNGDVRLSNTPEQWDPIPEFEGRDVVEVGDSGGRVVARLAYPEHDFRYRIEAEPDGDAIVLSVHLDGPLPASLEGRAGLNLEFLPTAFFGHGYLADGRPGLFPRHPTGPMTRRDDGGLEPGPLATGARLVLAPGDPERRVAIEVEDGTAALYDGRNEAQNGWYVVRTLLPAGRTGRVVEWRITAHRIPGWTRPPMIAHSQAGYHPLQEKVAVVEMDPAYAGPRDARLVRIHDGHETEALVGPLDPWGRWLRYDYARFDFTAVTEPGLYRIAVGQETTEPFPIAGDVYGAGLWQSSLDTFLPIQMDHVLVNDRYRVWHGASHLDDARQAPVDHEHFDLYAQGPTTDTEFQPGEHIPGLNVGGWFDAGDFDIRTQTQYATLTSLVLARETFGIEWDETTVEQENRYVDLRRPDGVPDILQQIEHGTVGLLAQYRAVGHAINGIIVPSLEQYTHLGDALTMTDNLVHDPSLDSLEVVGDRSGTPDDRWAFTSRSSALDYGAAAALAAASRVLRGYDDALADEALDTAVRVWDEDQSREPFTFRHGNTTGGRLEDEELKATVELLLTTGDEKYARRLDAMWPYIERSFGGNAALAVRALPAMDAAYRTRVEAAVRAYRERMDAALAENPFGVPVTTGGWGGSGAVLRFAVQNHILHREFPEIIGSEHTLRGLAYVLGTHPASSVSMVSGVGARSATHAYGSNRADYAFIPGGVIPGVLIVRPDLPEMQESWPFLWYESEYVIDVAAMLIYAANAADTLLRQ
jgi:endoglucanase